jgi:hypothetical protein
VGSRVAHVENYFEGKGFGSKQKCAKCAKHPPRRELVRDGFTMSMVCRDCWDPPEEPTTPPAANIPPEVPR